jgi:phospholipase/carboxylesterase
LICREEWLPLLRERAGLPVVQSHGRSDPVLSYQLAEELHRELASAGLQVEFVPFSGGHGIPNSALDALTALIQRIKR